MAEGAERISAWRDAGFSSEQIAAEVMRQSADMRAHGFHNAQIDEFFGLGVSGLTAQDVAEPVVKSLMADIQKTLKEREQITDLSFREAFDRGWGASIAGLIDREEVPTPLPEHMTRFDRVTAQAATLLGDVPAMWVGAGLGTGAGSITGPGAVVAGFAGAFGLPAGMRVVLMNAYENGKIESFDQFWDVVAAAVPATIKGQITGAAVGTVNVAGGAVGPGLAATTTTFGTEIATMVKVGAALDGRVPEPEEFLDAAIVLGGIRGARAASPHVVRRMRRIYARTGVRPRDTIREDPVDPSVAEDIQSYNHPVPRSYRGADAQTEAPRLAQARNPETLQFERGQQTGPARETRSRVLSQVDVGGKPASEGAIQKLHDLYTSTYDMNHPVKRIVDLLRDGHPIEAVNDAYKTLRLEVGAIGKANHYLEYAPFRYAGLSRIEGARPLKHILHDVSRRMDDFRSYVVSRRALELEQRGVRTGIDKDAARAEVRILQRDMEPIRQELFDYQRHVAEYLRDSGILRPEAFEAMMEANRDYVPFFRMLDGEFGVAGGPSTTKTGSVSNPIKHIVGSERALSDPLESVIKNTYVMISMAEKNRSLRTLVENVEKHPQGFEETGIRKLPDPVRKHKIGDEEVAQILRKYGRDGSESLTAEQALRLHEVLTEEFSMFRPDFFRPNRRGEVVLFRDGAKETWQVPDRIWEVFHGVDEVMLSPITKILAKPARTLRAGAVLTPEFMGSNMIRDGVSSFIFSKNGMHILDRQARGVWHVAGRTERYQEWVRSGGMQAALFSLDRQYLQQGLREMSEAGRFDHVRNVIRHPIEGLRLLSMLSEEATRVGEFDIARRAGKSIMQAGFESREITLDFGRIGAKTQGLNSISAFFNAQLQAPDKLVRELVVGDQKGTTAFRLAATVTVPSLLMYLLNRDEDGFDEIPQWERDLYWLVPVDSGVVRDLVGKNFDVHVPTRGNTWFRIPKPHEIGVIFGSGMERVAANILEDDPHAFDGFMRSVLAGSTPGVMPSALTPVVEAATNHDFFLDRPVIPQSLEGWLPEMQYTPYTHEVMKWMSNVLVQVPGLRHSELASPIMLENFVRSWTGGLGNYTMDIADNALRKAGVFPDSIRPQDTLKDLPVIRAFVVRNPGMSAKSIQRFYDEYDKRAQIILSREEALKLTDIEKEAAIRREFGELRSSVNPADIRKTMGGLAKLVRDINSNPEFDRVQKAQIIENTWFLMLQQAKLGMAIFDATE